MQMEPRDFALGFGLALAVGLLVGLERERSALATHRERFAGIRTFPLIALLGSLGGVFVAAVGPAGFLAPFLAAAGLVALAYLKETRGPGNPTLGLTTEFAALLVFGIGALPFLEIPWLDFRGRLVLAAGLGAVVMAALSLRDPLHRLAAGVNREDVFATVRFVLLAAVALPLLPDHAFDPWGALNPFKIGIFVVLIAGVSFFGYVAVRALGARRGIGVTAAFGGLVSSTAVTLSFGGRARTQPALAPACAFAIVLASTIMFPRMLLLVGIVNHDLFVASLVPLGAMLLAAAVGLLVLYLRAGSPKRADGESPQLDNPFSLKQALKLGLLFGAIRFAAAAGNDAFGSSGLFASATLSGLVDVDPIAISVSRMLSAGSVTQADAVLALTIAALTNTLVKTGIVFAIGGRRAGARVAVVLVPAAVVGTIAAFLFG